MNNYDGILERPFLAEHWYKGFVAAMAAWLPCFFFAAWIVPQSIPFAVGLASAFSAIILAAVLAQYEGFELQTQPSRYRAYTWVLGLRFGKWQPLPPISHVTLRPFNRSHSLSMTDGKDPVSLGFSATDFKWQVLLSVSHSPVGIVVTYADKKRASSIASALSTLLKAEPRSA